MDETADSSLVERAKAGDRSAFATLQGRYFAPVFDFAAHLTQSQDEAAEVARETFLKARDVLGGLRPGMSFRSWIFSIARTLTLSRLDRTPGIPPTTAGARGEARFDVVDVRRFAGPAAAGAAAPLVWAAAVGLGGEQLSLLDLHLRQGLESDEVADALGLKRENGRIMLQRLVRTAEDSMKAFIMQAKGREECGALDAALGPAGPEPAGSPQVRRAVERHVTLCPECQARYQGLTPLAAFGALVAILPPVGAREEALEGLMEQWPGPAADAAKRGAGGSHGRSFSEGVGSFFGGARSFIRVGAGLSLAAVVLATILLAPASPIALTRSDGPPVVLRADEPLAGGGSPTPFSGGGGGSTRTAAATVTPGGGPTATTAATTRPGPGSTVEPLSGGAGGAPSPAATSEPGAPTEAAAVTATATPPAPVTATVVIATPVTTPVPTPTPCVPSLSPNVSALTIAPGGASFFFLSNGACGSAPFDVRSESTWLTVSPGSGSVGPFASVQVNVSVDASKVPAGEGAYTGVLSIGGPGGSPIIITVSTIRGGGSPAVSVTQGQCSGSPVSFAVLASDDFGVNSVLISYVQSNGVTGQKSLTRTSGTPASGAWSVSWELPGGTPAVTIVSYTIVATDGAGHSGQASGSC